MSVNPFTDIQIENKCILKTHSRTWKAKVRTIFSPLILLNLTWSTMMPLHPDVAVVLCDAGLRVEEGKADAALGTQASIIAAAVLDGFSVKLVTQPKGTQTIIKLLVLLCFIYKQLYQC